MDILRQHRVTEGHNGRICLIVRSIGIQSGCVIAHRLIDADAVEVEVLLPRIPLRRLRDAHRDGIGAVGHTLDVVNRDVVQRRPFHIVLRVDVNIRNGATVYRIGEVEIIFTGAVLNVDADIGAGGRGSGKDRRTGTRKGILECSARA